MPDGGKVPGRVGGETVLSTKGQVVLPKAVRDHLGWRPGTRLDVEERPEGVLLRRASSVRPTTMEEVFGSARYHGPARTLKEMEEGAAEAVHEGWLADLARG